MNPEPPTPTDPSPAPPHDAWLCIACEYSLAGIDPGGVCPECGTRVALSMRDDRLAHSGPFWLYRLAQGATLMYVALILSWLSELPRLPPLSVTRASTFGLVLYRINYLAWVIGWIGKWMLATPEYVAAGRYRSQLWCWLIRIFATLAMVMYVGIIPVPYLWPQVELVLPIASIFTIALSYLYLRTLARRLPDKDLIFQTPLVLFALLIQEVINGLMPRISRALPIRLPTLQPPMEILLALAAMGYACVILARYTTRFTASANEAMDHYLKERGEVQPSSEERAISHSHTDSAASDPR